PFDPDEPVRGQGAEDLLVDAPHAARHLAGAVADQAAEVRLVAPCLAELGVGDRECPGDALRGTELADEAAGSGRGRGVGGHRMGSLVVELTQGLDCRCSTRAGAAPSALTSRQHTPAGSSALHTTEETATPRQPTSRRLPMFSGVIPPIARCG